MILEEHQRFIALNAMLNGHNDDEIMKTLSLSKEAFSQLIGFTTYEEYSEKTKNLKRMDDSPHIERLLLNVFSLDYYCCSHLTNKDGSYSIFTMNMLRDEFLKNPYPADLLKQMLIDLLPKVQTGNCLKASDGILMIPADIASKFDSVCLSAFKKYAFGNGILTRSLFKDIVRYFDIVEYTTLSPKLCRQFIETASKHGYHLCVLNQLVQLPIVDYLAVYQAFHALLKISNDSEKIMILTQDNRGTSKHLTISSSVVNILTKTPMLFDSCKYENGYIMVLTNTGYRPLILHEEVDLF